MKGIERELQVIQERKHWPLSFDDLLDDSVIEAAFVNIRKLLLLYLLVPQSEAEVERGFSCVKMIMADKRTNLGSESLEALMRLFHRNKSFSAEEVINIIEIWQSCFSR